MSEWFDIRWCPDGSEHDLTDERIAVADHGPMEGDWFVATCRRCGVGLIRSVYGGDGLENFLATLKGVEKVGD